MLPDGNLSNCLKGELSWTKNPSKANISHISDLHPRNTEAASDYCTSQPLKRIIQFSATDAHMSKTRALASQTAKVETSG